MATVSTVIITGLLSATPASRPALAENKAVEAFCVSCHEMNDYVRPEFEQSQHYRAAGDRVGCTDCHVPRDFPNKPLKHLSAIPMLYHHFAGAIDSRTKFNRKRLTLAERVWADMKANHGRECRNCHNFQTRKISGEQGQIVIWHRRAIAKGETCMDCHKGIAHRLPKGIDETGNQ